MSRFEILQHKIKDRENASRTVKGWKVTGDTIVFTNGCFDILHLGHLKYLAEASDLGNRLVVGLNSDASVSRLKGDSRPIHDLATRTHMLASLVFVDLVVVFEEDTPEQLIKAVGPDILVKGGDWAIDQIVGADFVKAQGGKVLTIPFLEGYSTSSIIEKTRKQD